jgi:ABC-type lipoprotein release transport system permease subunit
LVLAGVLIGAPLAAMLSRVSANLSYGIRDANFWTLASAGMLLVGVAIVAALVPARRASMVDPSVALRVE